MVPWAAAVQQPVSHVDVQNNLCLRLCGNAMPFESNLVGHIADHILRKANFEAS